MVCALIIVSAAPAFARDPWGSVDCDQTPSPGCDIGAGNDGGTGNADPGQGQEPQQEDSQSGGGTAPTGGGENSVAECDYEPSDYRPPGSAGSGTAPGLWLNGLCSASGVIQTPEYVAAFTPAEVARLARSQLRLPTPDIAANPSSDQLVTLPTWLWLSSGWEQQSATASVPGVSVTAVARPTSLVWFMGDGSTVMCRSGGTPFPAGGDPMAVSPDCGHIYRTSSAGQPNNAYPVSAAVHWSISWSGAGQSGTFPDMITTATAAFRVVESQAVNTGGG
ncbi:MAG: hypothetical protein GEV28_04470 [Actinophytocola sp.]|nr:hypothetical protein [Actinophytocola sp.]